MNAFRPVFGPVGMLIVFSLALNALLLTGPLYMMQVYDRVLASGSVPTLLVLTGIVAVLYASHGALDIVRVQITSRLGGRLVERLDAPIFQAANRRLLHQPDDQSPHQAQQDLEAIRAMSASPFATAVLDLPFAPIFLLATFAFNPLVGWAAVAGMAVLIALTLIGRWATAGALSKQFEHQARADRTAEQMRIEAETLISMGMLDNARSRWHEQRRLSLVHGRAAMDISAVLGGIGRAWRMALQSAILGIGAYVVLQGQMSAGTIVAASVLVGRALQPIETVIAQWPAVLRVAQGWDRLATLIAQTPATGTPTSLPRPEARLTLKGVFTGPNLTAPPILRHVDFELGPGAALGVIGPAGSGKSSLIRAITGAWPCLGGTIRLGGATLEQYDPTEKGRLIGYLPQRTAFLDGTVAENIARFDPFAADEKVILAAQRADAHQLILSLPKGYDTPLNAAAPTLSGGQMQRIGLARALFGDPVLLVLDEPNSALDADGAMALNAAIRQQKSTGGSVIITSHRPAALQECDLVLVLDGGRPSAFGPRDAVLQRQVSNHDQVQKSIKAGQKP